MAVSTADMRKQMSKIVDVAKSVTGLADMIQTQGEKSAKLAADAKDGEMDDATYKAFSKANKAVEAARAALFKEIKVLMDTCSGFQGLLDQAEKELKTK